MGALQGSLSPFMLPAERTFYSGRKGKIYSTKEAHQPLWSWNTNRHCSAHSPSSGKSETNEINRVHSAFPRWKRAPPKGNWGTTEAADGLLTRVSVMKGFKSDILFPLSENKKKKIDDGGAAGIQRISKTAVSSHVVAVISLLTLRLQY